MLEQIWLSAIAFVHHHGLAFWTILLLVSIAGAVAELRLAFPQVRRRSKCNKP